MKLKLLAFLALTSLVLVSGICAYSIANDYSFKTNIETHFGIFEFEGNPSGEKFPKRIRTFCRRKPVALLH